MIELSRKKLLDLANSLKAVDITYDTYDAQKRDGFRRWSKVAISYGKFGMNSKLFVDHETNIFYVVKTRSSAIFMYD